MGIFKKWFKKKSKAISYEDFWIWFNKNASVFFETVKRQSQIESRFFNKLSPKLNQVKEGIFFLTGMMDEQTAELILTPDGTIKNIVFVEELLEAAPPIKGWKFTALKPEMDINDISIQMEDQVFNKDNLFFYANEDEYYPDEIDLSFVYKFFSEKKNGLITTGTYLFLDNYLGELNFLTQIDHSDVRSPQQAEKEWVPIEKLKPFLTWRHKEFVEKYSGTRYNTENDEFSLMEGTYPDGSTTIALINTDLMKWDKKASHPWMAVLELNFEGKEKNGMPDEATSALLEKIEDELIDQLKDFEGYLNLGRQTFKGTREIYFACKDFRKPSKVFYHIECQYSPRLKIHFDIFKDKYWRSLNRFQQAL